MTKDQLDRETVAGLCHDPEKLAAFLGDLLRVVHLQAKEIERLTTHMEQHTARMLVPSQLPVVISELSALHARLQPSPRPAVAASIREELRGQRIPTKDMDDLC